VVPAVFFFPIQCKLDLHSSVVDLLAEELYCLLILCNFQLSCTPQRWGGLLSRWTTL